MEWRSWSVMECSGEVFGVHSTGERKRKSFWSVAEGHGMKWRGGAYLDYMVFFQGWDLVVMNPKF
jgi:hypothetical protein